MHDATNSEFCTPSSDRRMLGLAALWILIAIGLIYFPVHDFSFLEYDDRIYVLDNPDLQNGLTFNAIRSAFTKSYNASWHPLAIVSHAIDVELFGMNPGAHHLVNVALHALNALLLLFVFYRLTGLPIESAVVAALFAVHPQHVEPVAWISSRKDLLSTIFMLLAIAAYVRYTRRSAVSPYAWTCVFLTLGLLAKPMLVTLPCVLLLLDVWPLNRVTTPGELVRRTVEKTPLFGICIAFMIATHWVQSAGGAVKDLAAYPLSARLANAVLSYATYLQKFIWPSDLSVFYPHAARTASGMQIAASAVLVGALCVLALHQFRRRPHLFVGWYWFAGMLVPVIGLIQFGDHGMADRYTYVTHIGLSIALVWTARELYRNRPALYWPAAAVAFCVLLAYAVVSARNVPVWKDEIALFRDARKTIPLNNTIVANLSMGMMQRQLWEEALFVFRTGLDFPPPRVNHYNSLGICYGQLGRLDLARQAYLDGMAHDPEDSVASDNLGHNRRLIRQTEGEIADLLAAYERNPENASTFEELAVRWTKIGELDLAKQAYEYLREAFPESARASANLGKFYHHAGMNTAAAAELIRALELGADPHDLLYHVALAQYDGGDEAGARNTLREALRLRPPSLEAELMLERLDHAASPSFNTDPLY